MGINDLVRSIIVAQCWNAAGNWAGLVRAVAVCFSRCTAAAVGLN